MKDIYQQIWDADQNGNGIAPILDTATGNRQQGFIKVNANLDSTDEDFRVFTELHIPESKMSTYKLGLKLFDNYALSEQDVELETPEERTEVHNFVDAIIDTAPMQVARAYIAQQTGSSLTRQRWYNTIMEMWFRKYAISGDPDLSGFEHVIIGEQEGSKAKGYHFWYKYYLDDSFASAQDGQYKDSFPALTDDRIKYFGTKETGNQRLFPECVTISYRWFAPDYDRQGLRPLFKKIGGFFVGCSLEGLLALGTVRGHLGINAPKRAIINGAEYDMKLFHSPNRRHIRTFYPKFIRGVAAGSTNPVTEPTEPIVTPVIPPTVPDFIRIVAALVNPTGDDVGKETITIINISSEAQALNNWQIVDINGKRSTFSIPTLEAGDTFKIVLDGRGAQLSNRKDGTIKLLNDQGEMVHLVSYNRNQIREQGRTVLF
ncbi:MAG: lamin tail domain-containing protein [Bacteroidota bacterium]